MQETNDRERVISTFVFRRKRTQYKQQEHRRVQQLGNLEFDAQRCTSKGKLYAISRRQPFLDDWRESGDLRRPTSLIVLLESLQQSLEHVVQLGRGCVPADDRVTEPEETLRR
jgi:hypothetical protein